MAYADNKVKDLFAYRCPNCRQISHNNKWTILEEKGKCPECHLQCDAAVLKLIRVLILKRGRMSVS